MVSIKGGVYTPMYRVGNQKEVKVQPFLIDPYLVTNKDYLEFVRANPKWRRSKAKRLFAESDYLKNWKGDLEFDPDLADRPVVYVSWFAAKAYAKWKGKRLPTQDEWEFVARADEHQVDATHDVAFRNRILDWYGQPTPERPGRVGTMGKNLYGVHDLHGLVWEWVGDFNSVLITGESRQDNGIDRGLYCAAGSVGTADPSDYAAYMRYAFRSSLRANYTVKNLGFRCARNPKK